MNYGVNEATSTNTCERVFKKPCQISKMEHLAKCS